MSQWIETPDGSLVNLEGAKRISVDRWFADIDPNQWALRVDDSLAYVGAKEKCERMMQTARDLLVGVKS